jgi:ABC-2 type transport system permease protein
MLRSVFGKTLHDRRVSTLAWTAGLTGMTVMYLAIFPSIRGQLPQLQQMLDAYPDALKSIFGMQEMTTLTGYQDVEMFSMTAPLLFLMAAIGFGSSATTKEESEKTIDLLLSAPVTRSRVVVEKFGSFAVGMIAMSGGLFLTLAVGSRLIDEPLNLGNLAAAVLGAMLLGTQFGAVALLVGCATGRRGIAIAVSSALALGAFLLNSLAPLVDWLSDYQKLSPLYHSSGFQPLRNGPSPASAAVLVISAALFLGLAVMTFERRDLAA